LDIFNYKGLILLIKHFPKFSTIRINTQSLSLSLKQRLYLKLREERLRRTISFLDKILEGLWINNI
jgi:hypothetical protein